MNAAVNWQAFGLVVNAHMVHRRRTPTALARRAGVTEGVVLRAAAQLRIKQENMARLARVCGFAVSEFQQKNGGGDG